MVAVSRWTGIEVRALMQAARLTYVDMAHQMGVSDRMIGKWVAAGEDITPRPINQQALDTLLAQASPDARRRFIQATMGLTTIVYDDADTELVGSATENLTRRHRIDGRPMVLVDQGVFLAGPTAEPVWLSAFWIDIHPVTNADYHRFTSATAHRPPTHWTDGRFPDHLANHPVVFVTWHDAAAYATWAGKQLPSAHQWEKAARGTTGAIYPWGDQKTPFKCNVRESSMGTTTPVDCYRSGVSPYGVYDLCGNTWEWCSTATTGTRRQLKGAAFTSPFSRANPSAFNDADADMHDDDTSFRCITTAEAELLG